MTILIYIYIFITFLCIFLTRKAHYFTTRYDDAIMQEENSKAYVMNAIIGSYVFSFIPVLNVILLGVLLFAHADENWRMLSLQPWQKRWVPEGAYQKYKGLGLGLVPFVLTENPKDDIPHPEDAVIFGCDIFIPFFRLQGTLTFKYRK